MAPRAALYVMPSFAVLATAALVLGPGRERPAVGARVWGVPFEGAGRAAWRLETIERQFGADRAMAVEGIEVALMRLDERLGQWSGSSGEDGVVEASVDLPRGETLARQVELSITSPRGSLAAGRFELRPAAPLRLDRPPVKGTLTCVPEAACAAGGAVRFEVVVSRGVLAAPFKGTVVARLLRGTEPLAGWPVRVSSGGASLDPLAALGMLTDERGEVILRLSPTFHAVDLKLEATEPAVTVPDAARKAGEKTGGNPGGEKAGGSAGEKAGEKPGAPIKVTWEGDLPVVPGALWLAADPRGGMRVLSPVPRDRAFVSGLEAGGSRTFGAVVPLVKNDDGLFEGALPTSAMGEVRVTAVTLAGDAHEQGPGTVTMPFGSNETVTAAPRVEMLLDGVPYAERLEQKRAGTGRLLAVAVALTAAVFEAVLLVLYSRASQAALAAHLARAAEGSSDEERAAAARIAEGPASRALWLVAAVGLVLLAFGALATFSIVR